MNEWSAYAIISSGMWIDLVETPHVLSKKKRAYYDVWIMNVFGAQKTKI